jgi:hypothetical protein
MASDDPVFRSFRDFSTDDMPTEAVVSRRMLRRSRAALASSVVAHAVVELEAQLIKLEK